MTVVSETVVSRSVNARKPLALCRSWMFVPGMDQARQAEVIAGGADVVVADLEEFTDKSDRPVARERIVAMLETCRQSGVLGAVRINKLEEDGHEDLAGIMKGAPDFVFLPHSETAAQMRALDEAITAQEKLHGIPEGSTIIVPTIESAVGMVALGSMLRASARIKVSMLAVEDMANNLGAERSESGFELHYARSRFLMECVSAGCVAIDCPCTFRRIDVFQADTLFGRGLGYRAKCVVFPEHVHLLNAAYTPSEEQVMEAKALCAAFEKQKKQPPADLSLWVDAPKYNNARRLLDRHQQFLAVQQ
jgi:citrate lyase subunit beta/citryl-CoA lyase